VSAQLPFENRLENESQTGILFNFEEYLILVDWTGRTIRSDKRGHIDNYADTGGVATHLHPAAYYSGSMAHLCHAI
jgi:hypothetical protein